MLINLPNRMICSMIGRELTKYFIIDNQNGMPEVLTFMGDIDPETVTIAVKYFPIDPAEEFVKEFELIKDESGNRLDQRRISKEVVNRFYHDHDSFTPGEIVKYAKLVTTLDEYVSTHPCSIGSYTPPFRFVEGEEGVTMQ